MELINFILKKQLVLFLQFLEVTLGVTFPVLVKFHCTEKGVNFVYTLINSGVD